MNFTHFVAKPLEGGPLITVPASRVRRFGKRCIYGNATQFTVAELDNGEIVHLRHADQPDPKAFSCFVRKHLKGVWADTGLGRSASSESFSWARNKMERDLGFRRYEVISKWPFPTFANHINGGSRCLTEIPSELGGKRGSSQEC